MISGSVLECSQNEMLTEHSKYILLETVPRMNAVVFRCSVGVSFHLQATYTKDR